MTIKLNGSTAGSVALDAPASTTGNADISFKLPVADGSADQVLKTDGSGNLGFVAQNLGIAMVDQWSITGDNNKTDDQIIDFNWERADYHFAQIGTGLTYQGLGVWTFPQTGVYLIMCQFIMNATSPSYAGVKVEVSTDTGSNYSRIGYGYLNPNGYESVSFHAVFDVQNISTHRFRLKAMNDASTQYAGDTNALRSGFTVIRLGDT